MSTAKINPHTPSLDWEVLESPLFYNCPLTGKNKEAGTRAFINSQTGGLISSKMTGQYQIFSNLDFVSLAELIADEKGIKISHYTTSKGGKKVLVAFERPDQNFEIAGFPIESHLILMNSHDGTGCIEVGESHKLHRCNNMFASTMTRLKIFHNSNMNNQIEALKFQIMNVEASIAEELDTISTFANVKIDSAIIEQFKINWFGDFQDSEPTTTMKNKMLRFDQSVIQEVGQLGMNAFGLYNAVTHYTTHNFLKTGSCNEKDFPIFGERASMNKEAFSFCAAL